MVVASPLVRGAQPAAAPPSSAAPRRPTRATPARARAPSAPTCQIADGRRAVRSAASLGRAGVAWRCRAAAGTSSEAPAGSGEKPVASPETLCKLAREFTETGSGYFTPPRDELFSDDFVFRGPIIGPLCKKDYYTTLGAFKVYNWFPDIQSNSWGYNVDPQEPNRVWFFVRQTGTNTGQVTLGNISTFPATNKKAVVGPEVYSILFDENLKVKLLTVGYACDYDAPNTNSNKMGAAYGLLAAVGIELPGGKPFAITQIVLDVARGLVPAGTPMSTSKWEDVPEWYKKYTPRRVGAQDAPGY